MRDFTELFKSLDETTKTTKKVQALANYFDQAGDKDKVWTIALLAHKRPKRVIATSYLRTWTAELSEVPDWLFEESYHIVGDLAETIALLVKQEQQHDKTLSEWIDFLEGLRDESIEYVKEQLIWAWKGLNDHERFVFNKIITGGFRMGVSQKLMVKGLSKSTGIAENELAHRLMGDWNPFEITFDELVNNEATSFDDAKPYPFFLAYPVEGFDREIGDLSQWTAEYKWDGIRGQLIKRNDQVSIWSRGEELVTEKFPELVEAAKELPNGIVLDGEILTWNDDGVMGFQSLQTRLGRKTVSKKLMETAPVRFMAYDLLEWETEDIRAKKLDDRKERLKEIIQGSKSDVFMLSEVLSFTTLEALDKEKNRAREFGAEGLMLKERNSAYEVGRKKGGWYKWKVDPFTTDAVLTYAMRGHGRRANLYTDYTFGLWHEGELLTFAKAYSGLTDAEFKEVDAFVKKNTLERFGPVRQVKPELVFEVAFEGISLSKRHKSGVAVRFPRIHRWRKDKKVEEANSLDDLKGLII